MALTPKQIGACIYAQIGSFIPEPDSRLIDRQGWNQILTPSIPSVVMNEVYVSMMKDDDELEKIVQRTIAEYRELGLPFKWIVGPMSSPPRLRDVLTPLAAQQWWFKGMVAEVSLEIEANPAITVEVMTPFNARDYFAATAEGWNYDDSERAQLARKIEFVLTHGPAFRYYIARENGRAIATAGLILKDEFGYLVGGNAIPEARGRGAYKALIKARLEALRESGRTFAVTQARGATSAPILEKLGFETAYDAEVYLIK